MSIFYIITSTFFAVLVFGYLTDPKTHYTCFGDEVWWWVFCFFFPQIVSWFIPFSLWDLIGASVLAIYGFWGIFFYCTSFNEGYPSNLQYKKEVTK